MRYIIWVLLLLGWGTFCLKFDEWRERNNQQPATTQSTETIIEETLPHDTADVNEREQKEKEPVASEDGR